MLIRFVVKNLFSFGEEKEFNMLSNPRYTRLKHHKYNIKNLNILKMASIYGANGAGKSNLIKALSILQDIVSEETIPEGFSNKKFKFLNPDESTSQVLAVEFFQNEKTMHYALEIKDNIILTEELYLSGLGKKEDQLIFERKTDQNKKTTIKCSEDFENDAESKVLKSVIEKNLSKANKPLLKNLADLNNPFLKETETALNWFEDTLRIIMPEARPRALVYRISEDEEFRKYSEDMLRSFRTGITGLKLEKKTIQEFFGREREDVLDPILKKFEELEDGDALELQSITNEKLTLIKEKKGVFVKHLKLEHTNEAGRTASFDMDEVSDGTVRLLDFIPAFESVVSRNMVFVIDEMERSIHPLLIKELIQKFSEDDQSKGQLIFSTHESNLLDQELLRQDEIWFAEKDTAGCTDLYSLSDFKEHNTIDIRKGYLNGRYGAIPFLGNLTNLNWHKYDTEK